MRASLLAAAALLTLALAACGGDDENGGADGEDDIVPTATATTSTGTRTPAPTGTTEGGGPAGTAQETVAVEEKEFTLTADPDEVPSGQITFEVNNTGTLAHDLHVIRSSADPASLPVEGAEVNLEEVELVGEIADDIPAGEEASTTVAMPPGDYILICNVPAHYQGGMRTGFTVN
jgi:uncharacterized cupredoxin-like copper-binding protein